MNPLLNLHIVAEETVPIEEALAQLGALEQSAPRHVDNDITRRIRLSDGTVAYVFEDPERMKH